jgi:hypothetical protein
MKKNNKSIGSIFLPGLNGKKVQTDVFIYEEKIYGISDTLAFEIDYKIENELLYFEQFYSNSFYLLYIKDLIIFLCEHFKIYKIIIAKNRLQTVCGNLFLDDVFVETYNKEKNEISIEYVRNL